jgi:hypothetical protein
LIATIARIFRVALRPRRPAHKAARLKDLHGIRQALGHCVFDCEGQSAQRLRHRIEQARSPQELWLLRNDAYQLISQRHNQQVAAERINALIASFEGWVDAKQLVRIK